MTLEDYLCNFEELDGVFCIQVSKQQIDTLCIESLLLLLLALLLSNFVYLL
jgi:hypothetical protein